MPKTPNASEQGPSSGGGGNTTGLAFSTHLYSRDYGLGKGVLADIDALNAMSAAAASATPFVEQGLNRGGTGVKMEISAGVWNLSPSKQWVIDGNLIAGNQIVVGQGQGATELLLPDRGGALGSGGTSLAFTNSFRLGSVAHPGDPNTVQLEFPSIPPGPNGVDALQLGDCIVFQVLNQGVPEWEHHAVSATSVAGDPTKIQFKVGEAGLAIDGQVPPPQVCYFLFVAINVVNFRDPNEFQMDALQITGGSSLGNPLDAVLIRFSSRAHWESGLRLTGGWKKAVISPSPFGIKGVTAGKLQNTDHSYMDGVTFDNDGSGAVLLFDNSQGSWLNAILTANGFPGGGRDNHFENIQGGGPKAGYFFTCTDGGALQSADFSGANFKDGYGLADFEGVWGAQPAEFVGVDGIQGTAWKHESYGNKWLRDRTGQRKFWDFERVMLRAETSVAVNGSTGTGTPHNFTDQPYLLTNVTMSIVGGVPQLVGTIAQTDCAIQVDDLVQVGNAVDARLLGEGIVSAVTTAVAIVGGKPAFTSTITILRPDYTGAGFTVAGVAATLGFIGWIQCGILERFDIGWTIDLSTSDRYAQGQFRSDVDTIGVGYVSLLMDDLTPATRRKLPIWRARSLQPVGGSDAFALGGDSILWSGTGKASQMDIGRTIVSPLVATGTDTVAGIVGATGWVMTNPTVAGTGQVYLMRPRSTTLPPRVEVRRGASKWYLFPHDRTDGSTIVPGNLVELTSQDKNMCVRRSLAGAPNKTFELFGVAMGYSPSGSVGPPATNITVAPIPSTLVPGNNGECRAGTALLMVMAIDPGQTLTGDDPVSVTATGAIVAGAQVVDNGDGTVSQIALTGGVPNPGQLIVGVAAFAASGGFVTVQFVRSRWT